jgi:hypothetical protein
MKNSIAPLVIVIFVATGLFIACAYLYIENNNLKNANHKQLVEFKDLTQENEHLANDVEMLKKVLREYEDLHPELGNNSNSYFNNY